MKHCLNKASICVESVILFFLSLLYRTTYEVAPVFVLLEKALLDEMIKLVGWEEGEGIFCPGKS